MVDFSSIKKIEIPEGEVKSIIRNGVILWKKGRLPSEYQEVEYIKSTGTQYIDTGYKPTGNTKVEMEFADFSTPGGVIFGAYNNGWQNLSFGAYFNATSNNDGVWRHYADNKQIMMPSPSSGTLIFDKGVDIINGVTRYSSSTKTFTSPFNMYIFCGNGYNSAFTQKTQYKLISFKIYENDELQRDFIPCYRKSDSVIGLYDMVNDNFYINSGSGTFIKGGDV